MAVIRCPLDVGTPDGIRTRSAVRRLIESQRTLPIRLPEQDVWSG